MEDLIERICRRLCEFDGRDPDEDWTIVSQTGGGAIQLAIALRPGEHQRWRTYRPQVRLMLQALREPTGEMRAAWDAMPGNLRYSEAHVRMIDEALKKATTTSALKA